MQICYFCVKWILEFQYFDITKSSHPFARNHVENNEEIYMPYSGELAGKREREIYCCRIFLPIDFGIIGAKANSNSSSIE
jgi:hypothetical protein